MLMIWGIPFVFWLQGGIGLLMFLVFLLKVYVVFFGPAPPGDDPHE